MRVIGLTGGIGSGKSTASRFLAELGAAVIDADKVGHELLKPNTKIWQQLAAAFGKQILTSNGEINRKKLGRLVFGNPRRLDLLSQLMHPEIKKAVKVQLLEYQRQGASVAILEAPLLVEAGWTELVDEVWVTTASETTVLKRLKQQLGLSRKESLARIRSQLPLEERLKHADVVLNTELNLDELRGKIKELWQRL
ncbi:MAG: dephospho-CoA kinase [Dehalococcoidales bacterium]|jgi:dephospho-CoA kinase|nr:dephospho-CoA kinase [Dehalococcoidales bacterium]|tara:strand:- start:1488 stop:2075 length:588 start_codon:yes stop_codon:yes gene_type:complete